MDLKGKDLLEFTANKGADKANSSYKKMIILGFLAGLYISIGYALYLKAISSSDSEWAGLIGSFLFPIGLLLIVVAGGDLFTGNILDVAVSYLLKKVPLSLLVRNWVVVFLSNALGAVFLAYTYGEVLGFNDALMQTGTLQYAIDGKLNWSPWEMIVSGMLCNILVTLGIWLSNSSKSNVGKMFLLWVPIAAFVYLGFQHSVANLYLLTSGLFAGVTTIGPVLSNLLFVVIGNILGGAVVVAGLYAAAYGD
ncbi:formate/nitrite transporter family protein [Fundicoccus culcitae]|uniref:Formate/nitrite transporter family protein n=1 Tax=Fundicoccus culcitae TaxID=2969821 RepID=A0ABY5P4B0_9LACT|nr:formate/nitrite transporter family protein [Fundicoccus culcitae]UUX33578.1 formate/nitrite transporter family protein [Fundicoccus culcitae]